MPDGAADCGDALTWIGAERSRLDAECARIERQRAALLAVKVALMRYAELVGLEQAPPLPLSGGAPEDADCGAVEVC